MRSLSAGHSQISNVTISLAIIIIIIIIIIISCAYAGEYFLQSEISCRILILYKVLRVMSFLFSRYRQLYKAFSFWNYLVWTWSWVRLHTADYKQGDKYHAPEPLSAFQRCTKAVMDAVENCARFTITQLVLHHRSCLSPTDFNHSCPLPAHSHYTLQLIRQQMHWSA